MAQTPRKKRTPPPANETKAQRFVRVGKARLNRALTDIRLISGLSNTSTYEYNPAQIKTITDHLDKAVAEVKSRFANPNAPKTATGIEL